MSRSRKAGHAIGEPGRLKKPARPGALKRPAPHSPRARSVDLRDPYAIHVPDSQESSPAPRPQNEARGSPLRDLDSSSSESSSGPDEVPALAPIGSGTGRPKRLNSVSKAHIEPSIEEAIKLSTTAVGARRSARQQKNRAQTVPPSTQRVQKPAPSASKKATRSASAKRVTRAASKAATPARAMGALRDTPCLGCLRSALAGLSKGECYDKAGSRGARCYKCASGHSCEPIPAGVLPAARLYLAARVAGDNDQIDKLRTTVRVLLANPGLVGGVVAGAGAGESAEEKKERLRSAMHEAVDFLFGL